MNNEELLNKIQGLKDKRDTMNDLYDDQIKTYMGMLEAKLLAEGATGLKTSEATAYWSPQTKVEVKDWNKVMEFVYKNKAFDILQKRITPTALEARINAGASIEGVTLTKGAKTFIIKGAKEK